MSNPAKAAVPLKVPSPKPTDPPDAEAPYVWSYFAQRRAAGYIGIALPPVVLVYAFLTHICVPSSISASYYTGVRNYFVGSLCAVGVFLVSSVGYDEDKYWSWFAGAMAFVVAFCPTTPDQAGCIPALQPPFVRTDTVHMAAAVALFLTFAIFCLFLFTRTQEQSGFWPKLSNLPRQKRRRNIVFIVCGSIMVVAMLTYGVLRWVGAQTPNHLLLIVEWVCLWSFGFAWLVKGQQLFKDAS